MPSGDQPGAPGPAPARSPCTLREDGVTNDARGEGPAAAPSSREPSGDGAIWPPTPSPSFSGLPTAFLRRYGATGYSRRFVVETHSRPALSTAPPAARLTFTRRSSRPAPSPTIATRLPASGTAPSAPSRDTA